MVRNCNTPPQSRTTPPQCLEILLIEDSLSDARFLQEVLKGSVLGRSCWHHATRLQDGLAILKAESIQMILLDMTLPDSYGLASVDALATQAPQVPIVVLTNSNDDELAVQAVRHGAQDYLFKRHITPDTVVRALRYALERKHAAEALRIANETLELRVQQRTAELKTTNEILRREIAQRRQVQARLTLAQQVGKIGTFEWLIDNAQVCWTAELEALYGLEEGSFGDRDSPWLDRIDPEDRPQVEAAIQQSFRTTQGLNTEFRTRWPNSTLHWIAVTSRMFPATQTQPRRMVGLHMDITEKKQLEAQFLRAQRLESLGTLASGIAHDLNNILTPILSVAQLLPLKFPELNEHNRNLLNIIETSARRGSELIKQILSFSRGLDGQRVGVQICHLLTEIRQIIRQTLPKSIDISINIEPDLWLVNGDVTQLHQVLMNLCVNARDAMPQGGTLSIGAQNVVVDQHLARQHLDAVTGPHVQITVADTGVGMAPDVVHRIFDPFFTTKAIGKGTGLGLSAVLGIVKSHGGFVDVQSQPQQGSQFSIYLPANLIPIPAQDDAGAIYAGHGEVILVVDDEATIREVIKTTLETYGYRVLTAEQGLDAIALYAKQAQTIDAVILDMMMPTLDGSATLPALQQLDTDVKAIAISGLQSTEMVRKTEQLGFYTFLPKPIDTSDLLNTLHDCLQISSVP
ncbi:MAG: response regulator [Spirulina sp. SIO3F2]|nr:response regulator [Spirulina sp. SIO3F2]